MRSTILIPAVRHRRSQTLGTAASAAIVHPVRVRSASTGSKPFVGERRDGREGGLVDPKREPAVILPGLAHKVVQSTTGAKSSKPRTVALLSIPHPTAGIRGGVRALELWHDDEGNGVI